MNRRRETAAERRKREANEAMNVAFVLSSLAREVSDDIVRSGFLPYSWGRTHPDPKVWGDMVETAASVDRWCDRVAPYWAAKYRAVISAIHAAEARREAGRDPVLSTAHAIVATHYVVTLDLDPADRVAALLSYVPEAPLTHAPDLWREALVIAIPAALAAAAPTAESMIETPMPETETEEETR